MLEPIDDQRGVGLLSEKGGGGHVISTYVCTVYVKKSSADAAVAMAATKRQHMAVLHHAVLAIAKIWNTARVHRRV